MKNLIIIISLIAFSSLCGMAQVTTPSNSGGATDYVGWDNTNAFPLEIRHDGSQPMIFYTDGLEWMRLTPAGFLGINTASPSMRFHLHNGGMLSTGTTGANPDLGAGTVLMWIPDVQAFRAGTAVGAEWDSGDVGANSFAFGEDVTASGDYSVSFGENNVSSNTASFSGGLNNTSDGLPSYAALQSEYISTPWR